MGLLVFPTRYAQDSGHHCQDAAVLVQVQIHPQMVLSLCSNPQEWISAGSRAWMLRQKDTSCPHEKC